MRACVRCMGPVLTLAAAMAYGRPIFYAPPDRRAEAEAAKRALTANAAAAKSDHLAIIGDNRKLLVFPLDQIPELSRGTGVQLQKYKDASLADAKTFRAADGLTWRLGEKTRTETDLRLWRGDRAQTGRLPPNGFPKSGKFS